MKKYLGLIPIALFVFMLGCGGGGGGGSSSNGSNGSTNATTGFTSGQTNADVNSTILGQTVSRTTSGIGGVTVRFYDSGGTLLGTAVSRANGYFDANVPTTATRAEVDQAGIPNANQKIYLYDGVRYQAVGNGLSCNRIILPPLTPGVLTPMETAMSFYLSTDPPEFPTGCF